MIRFFFVKFKADSNLDKKACVKSPPSKITEKLNKF